MTRRISLSSACFRRYVYVETNNRTLYKDIGYVESSYLLFISICCVCVMQGLHPIVAPLSTGFYNLFALLTIMPPLEQKPEKKIAAHHLRYTSPAIAGSGLALESQDAVQERRRAKAIKVCTILKIDHP